jgi:hypothetical protein
MIDYTLSFAVVTAVRRVSPTPVHSPRLLTADRRIDVKAYELTAFDQIGIA